MAIDLSVLICSTHTRYKTFGPAIAEQVWEQYETLSPEHQARLEILMLTDNKAMMLGSKRNVMVDMAQGRYVQFIDDDDRIEPDMFETVLNAIDEHGPDVITFDVLVSMNGESSRVCRYSKTFGQDRNTAQGYERIPNHICVVRRELAQMVSFPDVLYGEDSGYSKALLPHLNTEHRINRVLYHYDYSDETTETQLERKARYLAGRRGAIVDVVILSNAKDAALQAMTQETIDTCISGARPMRVSITVMEQNPNVVHRDCRTVHVSDVFNYNAFANQGLRLGSAPWVMVANNDLIFHEGWLRALIAVNHPVVSPKCPRDKRQAHVYVPTRGYTNAVNFSGWCFMMKRELWSKIGGFDECVSFWCSDDVVIQQVKAVGIEPMLVPASSVEHVQSVTLRQDQTVDELTWGQLDIFIGKYGTHKLASHPRYLEWKQRASATA